jgi:hypothetical protein
MNNRMIELAQTAGLYVDLNGQPWPKCMTAEECELVYAKFAQLIVAECADIINHRADTCSDWLDSVKANEAVREGQRECAKTIKEHFGVEE